jgi:hypothetical protein
MATTVTIELPPREELRSPPGEPDQAYAPHQDATVARVKQKWNDPSINKWRIAAAFASFAITGASDGVYGVSFISSSNQLDLSCQRGPLTMSRL